MSPKNLSLALFLLYPFTGLFAQQDPCDCTGTNQTLQYRSKVKHRKTYSRYPLATRIIEPAEIIEWQQIYADSTRDVNRGSKRLDIITNTPEDTLYILKGYLYYIKMEDDCDYHMEIGPEDSAATRAVVELTMEYCSNQRHIFEYITDYLAARGTRITSYKLRREFNPGIPITLMGLGFYDGWHGPDDHGRVYTHGSSWELHPVVYVNFVE